MGKKRPQIARRMISIPSDLDAKMSQYKGVNWSSVAKLAFEAKLGSLSQPKVSKEMKNAVERLKALEEDEVGEAYKAGFKAGKSWASGKANPKELRRIAALKMDNLANWDWLFDNNDTSAFASHQSLHATIVGSESIDRNEADEFFEWVGAIREEMFDGDYVSGFAEGALEFWDEYQDLKAK